MKEINTRTATKAATKKRKGNTGGAEKKKSVKSKKKENTHQGKKEKQGQRKKKRQNDAKKSNRKSNSKESEDESSSSDEQEPFIRAGKRVVHNKSMDFLNWDDDDDDDDDDSWGVGTLVEDENIVRDVVLIDFCPVKQKVMCLSLWKGYGYDDYVSWEPLKNIKEEQPHRCE